MGLKDEFGSDEEQSENELDDSVAYIYVRGSDSADAYHLMSEKHGGSALVREALQSQDDWEDQHDFFQSLIIKMEPLFKEGNWEPLLSELGVPASGLHQYLSDNPEVKRDLLRQMKEEQDSDSDDSEEEAEAPADD